MKYLIVCILGCIFLVSSCGIVSKEIEQLSFNYWNEEEPSVVLFPKEDSNEIQLFTDAINNSELLKDKIITTEPLLSLNLQMADGDEKNYHLWILTSGEGYLQQLHPDENETFQLDSSVAQELHNYFEDQAQLKLINTEIEFENE